MDDQTKELAKSNMQKELNLLSKAMEDENITLMFEYTFDIAMVIFSGVVAMLPAEKRTAFIEHLLIKQKERINHLTSLLEEE